MACKSCVSEVTSAKKTINSASGDENSLLFVICLTVTGDRQWHFPICERLGTRPTADAAERMIVRIIGEAT